MSPRQHLRRRCWWCRRPWEVPVMADHENRDTRYIGDNPDARARQFAQLRQVAGCPKPGDDTLLREPKGQFDLDRQLSA